MLQITIQPSGVEVVPQGVSVKYTITDDTDSTIPRIDGSFIVSSTAEIPASLETRLNQAKDVAAYETDVDYSISQDGTLQPTDVVKQQNT